MPNTTYRIPYRVSDEMETWLVAQPNRVGPISLGDNYTEITYNHDAAQKTAFLNQWVTRYSVFVNGIGENINKYDNTIYTTSNPPPGGSGVAREDCVADWHVSMTKTNLPITFGDVYNQANSDGKSVQIDTNGKTQVKLQVNWNKIGTGTHTVQVIEVGTANVLISMNVVSGRNTTALTPIPAFATNSVKFYKLQCKTTLATDDPIFEGARIYLK